MSEAHITHCFPMFLFFLFFFLSNIFQSICPVFSDGGLTKNDKTATFTALKIYREGSEFGPVRYSIGYAFRGGNKDAMLQLHSSETSDAQPCTFPHFNFFPSYKTEKV